LEKALRRLRCSITVKRQLSTLYAIYKPTQHKRTW
jgi:hypothetical protein